MKEGTRRGGSALTRREMHAKIQPIRFNENTLSHTQMELADVQKHKKKKAKTQFKVMKKVKCGWSERVSCELSWVLTSTYRDAHCRTQTHSSPLPPQITSVSTCLQRNTLHVRNPINSRKKKNKKTQEGIGWIEGERSAQKSLTVRFVNHEEPGGFTRLDDASVGGMNTFCQKLFVLTILSSVLNKVF